MIRSGAERAWRGLERLRATRGPHGVVLIYHRVATPATDPWGIAVSPENFAAHMAVLSQFGVPRSLGDFADRLRFAKRPERSIVVTFDDGYADNLGALRILEAHRIPATIFVVSRAVGNPRAFWWDLLTRIFLETPRLPAVLRLDAGRQRRTYDLGAAAHQDAETLARSAGWRADVEVSTNERQRTYLAVWEQLLGLPPDEIAAAVARLAEWAEMADATPREGDGRPVTEAELAQLAASPLIEIGGHTRTHADISRLSPKEASDEIGGGRRDLIEMTGQEVRSFAYPYGRSGPRTISDLSGRGSPARPGAASGSPRRATTRLRCPGSTFPILIPRSSKGACRASLDPHPGMPAGRDTDSPNASVLVGREGGEGRRRRVGHFWTG